MMRSATPPSERGRRSIYADFGRHEQRCYSPPMRRRWLVWGTVAGFGAALLFACSGSKKDAKDPSDKPAYQDETPKWEGATNPTPEDPKPTKSSSGSAGSSGGAVHE